MEIKTKFDIGDHFYYMKDNKVQTNIVDSFDIHINRESTKPYKVKHHVIYRHEDCMFKTKEELLASL